ncbi:MAG: hypothetical protein U5L00_07930 [Desulfovermiculus sp.]|nr:hypothetical protein [Desulfovermiculus sp.]
MDNHFHLVVRTYPESDVSDRELIQRYKEYYGQDQIIAGAGIIGSKEFVGEVFDQVKFLLGSKDEQRFTAVGGVEGLYSMKRLGAKY